MHMLTYCDMRLSTPDLGLWSGASSFETIYDTSDTIIGC